MDNKVLDFVNEMTIIILEAKKLDPLDLDDEKISAFVSSRQYSLTNGRMTMTYSLGRRALSLEFDLYNLSPSIWKTHDYVLRLDLKEWLDDTRAKIEKVKSKKGGEVK